MDKETRQAFANLAAALALIARKQTIQDERLARIEDLLTPKAGDGPTMQETMENLIGAIERNAAATTTYLKDIKALVANLPLDVVKAIDGNLGPLAKAK